MGWALIGVLNAGIQILLIIGVGYCCSKYKLLEGERFMPQANPLMVMICFPAFNLYKVGISLQLQDPQAWRELSAYMMWIAIIQVGIVIYTWAFNKGDIGEAGLLNLLLSANNTVIIGLPIMYATTGETGARVSLLTSVALFLQVMPFSIVAFELERWLLQQVQQHLDAAHPEHSTASKSGTAHDRAKQHLRLGRVQVVKAGAPAFRGTSGAAAAAARPLPSTSHAGREGDAASAEAQGVLHDQQHVAALQLAATAQDLVGRDRNSTPSLASPSGGGAPAANIRSFGISAPPAAQERQRSAFLQQQPLSDAPHHPSIAIDLFPEGQGLDLELGAGSDTSPHRTESLLLRSREVGSKHFKQMSLAHSGRATSITVAELSRAEQASQVRRATLLRQRRRQPHLSSVDCPLPMDFAQLHLVPHARMSTAYSAEQVASAKQSLIEGHGGHIPFYKRFLTEHAQLVSVTVIVFKNPMLWSLVLALIVSVSGLRVFLDPASPQYVEGLGWIAMTLLLLANITVPLALFSNGVWMYGKSLKTSPQKLAIILLMKWTVLPLLQMGCAKAVQLDTASAMSLVLLSATPTASTAFVVAAQYGRGTELVTLVTIVCTVLLVPAVLMWLYLPGIMGVWTYDLSHLPMDAIS